MTLCSAGGAFQRSKCEGAPMAALAILLRFCDRQGWSPALRDDLMRLSLVRPERRGQCRRMEVPDSDQAMT